MYCRNCGAELPESARFCSKCGTQVLRYQPKAKETETAAKDQVDLAALVRDYQASDGDRRMAAFDRLYMASFPKVRAYVQYYARNEETANDCAEEAFMTCLQQLDTLQNPDGYLKWIRTIAYHKFVDRIRKDSKVTAFDMVLDDEGNEASAEDFLADETLPMPEDAYANEELQRLIRDALQNMTVMQQVMIKGHYYDEKSVQTLAEEYGVPVNTVKTHLSRGRNSLKSQIENYANAYGLKLVPLAIVPFMAMLGGQEVKACEVGITAATTAASLASLHAAMGAGGSAAAAGSAGAGAAAGTGAAGSGTAAATGTATATGTSGTTAAGAATAATGTGTAATAGTAAAGTGLAVKVGAGVIAAAVAAGGAGTAVYMHAQNTVEAVDTRTKEEQPVEEIEEIPAADEESTSHDVLDDVLLTAIGAIGQSGMNTLTSPYTIATFATDQTGPILAGYDGDTGIYAAYYKDLDGDGEDELLVFDRQFDDEFLGYWQLRMMVYEQDGTRSNVVRLMTIKESGNEMTYDYQTLHVYLKDLEHALEILIDEYGYQYLNVTGGYEGLTGYQYHDGELEQVGMVTFYGSDTNGEGVDQDTQSRLHAMELETSADALIRNEGLLYGDDALNGFMSAEEPGITNVLRWDCESTVPFDRGGFDLSTEERASENYNTLTFVNEDQDDNAMTWRN